VLLQHPQERRQKHQSDLFLLRTLSDVSVVVGRRLGAPAAEPGEAGGAGLLRLPVDRSSRSILRQKGVVRRSLEGEPPGELPSCTGAAAPDETCQGSAEEERVELDLSRAVLLWPADDAIQDLRNLWEPGASPSSSPTPRLRFDTIVALDATWQYAREMSRGCAALASLQKVQLTGQTGRDLPRPGFLVRKPERLPGDVQGYCTAEAVALFLDQVESSGPQAAPPPPHGRQPEQDTSSIMRKLRIQEPLVCAGGPGCDESAEQTVLPPLSPGSVGTYKGGRFYEAVMRPLRLYVRLQLGHAQQVRHRVDRPGYDPGMIADFAAGGRPGQAGSPDGG